MPLFALSIFAKPVTRSNTPTRVGDEPVLHKSVRLPAEQDVSSIEGQLEPTTELHLDILDFHLPIDVSLPLDSTLLATPKYFHEQEKDDHRAYGYGADTTIRRGTDARYRALKSTFNALVDFGGAYNFVFWLAHGTLLGQHWGGHVMPFDEDIDVQTSFNALHEMMKHQSTTFRNRYFFEINPWYIHRASMNNRKRQMEAQSVTRMGSGGPETVLAKYKPEPNVIDARFMDTKTGVFIDITVLATESADDVWHDSSDGRARATVMETLQDKSVHQYKYKDISPLQRCSFEGSETWCPHATTRILKEEYSRYEEYQHKTWRFDRTEGRFTHISCAQLAEMFTRPTAGNCDRDCQVIVRHDHSLTWGYTDNPGECLLIVEYEVPSPGGSSRQMLKRFHGVRDGDRGLPSLAAS